MFFFLFSNWLTKKFCFVKFLLLLLIFSAWSRIPNQMSTHSGREEDKRKEEEEKEEGEEEKNDLSYESQSKTVEGKRRPLSFLASDEMTKNTIVSASSSSSNFPYFSRKKSFISIIFYGNHIFPTRKKDNDDDEQTLKSPEAEKTTQEEDGNFSVYFYILLSLGKKSRFRIYFPFVVTIRMLDLEGGKRGERQNQEEPKSRCYHVFFPFPPPSH